jgi:hypothetical protein
MKDESTASSVDLNNDNDDIDDNDDNGDTEASSVLGDEDDITSPEAPVRTGQTKRRQLRKNIYMEQKDVVKFISKRNKYSQELGEKLKSVCAEVELVPDKSLIIVTKKLRSRRINDWNKRCCSIVTKFCSRFEKTCFELKKSNSVRKALPKLGRMLKWSNAAYWMESNNKRLAVMTEQSEYEQVLENVREFLGDYGKPIMHSSPHTVRGYRVNFARGNKKERINEITNCPFPAIVETIKTSGDNAFESISENS